MIKAYYEAIIFNCIAVDYFDTLEEFKKANKKNKYFSASLFDKDGYFIKEVI